MTTIHSTAIARALANLEALALPADATELQVQRYRALVELQSVLIGGLRALAAVEAEETAQAEGVHPLAPALVLVHIAAADPKATAPQLAARYAEVQAAAALVAGQASAQPAPVVPGPVMSDPHAALLPVPMPPMEAAPPEQLPVAFAPWYLETLRAEFGRHGWVATVAGAMQHWAQHGRRQDRKWRPDAPAPAWGPQEEYAPAGTSL